MTTIKFLGHACFQVLGPQTSLLFDPFLTNNPFQVCRPDQIDCSYILVSHGHHDHLGDTVAIARRTGATIISTAEIATACEQQNCQSHAMHLGGQHQFPFGTVKLTLAFHGAGIAGGHACGFLVNFAGTTIYFAGDTSLFSDMSLIGRTSIDYALLPIGDNFTMGPADAAEAVGLLKPKAVIPMHYNTWPLIAQSPTAFKQQVESQFHVPVIILNPGDSITI